MGVTTTSVSSCHSLRQNKWRAQGVRAAWTTVNVPLKKSCSNLRLERGAPVSCRYGSKTRKAVSTGYKPASTGGTDAAVFF